MSDSFAIEVYRYTLYDPDDNSKVREGQSPSRWTRNWSSRATVLTKAYKQALNAAQDWQSRKNHYGSRIELIEDGGCRIILIEFPPRILKRDRGTGWGSHGNP